MPKIKLRLIAWVAMAIFAAAAWSSKSLAQDIQPFSLSAAALLELAAAPAPRDKFPVAFRSEVLRYEFDDHYRLTLTSHQIYRIDSVEAVEEYGQIGSAWEPYRQKRPELRARVVTPDGREHLFDPTTLSDETVATGDARKFDDLHFLRGPLPAIAPGSVVEILKIVSDQEPKFASGNSYEVAIGTHGAVESTSVTVITPRTLPFSHKIRLLPNATVSEVERDGVREFTLQQGPLSLDWADMYVEAAGDARLWPQLAFSTGASWDEVAAGYGALVQTAIRPDEVRALLPADLPADPRQRLARLLAILHERVRYTGVFFGQGDIVPNPPAVTLERRFGDCKDKAVVLASLLRAAGMPAQVALLNSGLDPDVDPDLPGIGGFNHMIVHVPGSENFWIDATAEHLGAGETPYQNTGRWALLIGPTERPLVQTPGMEPAQNRGFERREVTMADVGPGEIHVAARLNGSGAAALRELASYENKANQKNLLEQFRKNYSAKSTSGFELREDATTGDVTFDFELHKVDAATTGLQEAGIAMSLAELFSGIPFGLHAKEPNKLPATEDDDANPESSPATRTLDWVFQPFVSELQIKVAPPKGFKLRAVPKSGEKNLGPLILTQTYSEDVDGSLIGTIRADSARGRYTAEEGRAFRSAYLAEESSLLLAIRYDHESWLLVRDGKPAAALRRHTELIEAEPRNAMHHVRAAAQLVDFGLVEEAKAQSQRATEIDPKSAWAFYFLGYVLQNDELGRRFRRTFDRDGSIRAYREAIKLDPDNMDMRLNLAAVAEVNADGLRYGEGSDVELAIENYKEVVANRPEWAPGKEWLIQALWQRRKYDEVVRVATDAGDSAFAAGALLAARVMKVGPEEALREDSSRTNAAGHRARISSAMTMLWAQRSYDEARALQAASGNDGIPQEAAALVDLLEKVVQVEELPEPPPTAAGASESLVRLMFRGPVAKKDLSPLLSDQARGDKDFESVLVEFRNGTRLVSDGLGRRVGQDPAFLRDMVLSNVDFKEAPFTERAKRVNVTLGGARLGAFYLVHEDQSWKLLAMFPYSPPIAREALRLVDAGDVAGARDWLLAVKSEIQADPNAEIGPYKYFLAALSNADSLNDSAALRLATLALLVVNSPEAVEAEDLRRAADGLKTPAQEEILESARFSVAREKGDGQLALAAAESFNRLKPGTFDAHSMLAQSYEIASRWEDAELASRAWIAERPGDSAAKQALVRAFNGQGRFSDALEILAPDVRQGTANASQLNNYAWQALVADSVDSVAVKAAENSHTQRQRRDYSSAHTLACLYAEQGRVTEARRVLLQMLDDQPQADPLSGEIWLVRGLIAESLGEMQSATRAYRKIEKPRQSRANSVYAIATARLARLEGHAVALARGP